MIELSLSAVVPVATSLKFSDLILIGSKLGPKTRNTYEGPNNSMCALAAAYRAKFGHKIDWIELAHRKERNIEESLAVKLGISKGMAIFVSLANDLFIPRPAIAYTLKLFGK